MLPRMKAPLNVRLIALAFAATLISVSAPEPAYANGWDSSLNTWVARGATDEDTGAAFGTSCADPDYIADGSADDVQLQAAIEHTLTGGTVHICPGTYSFASHLAPSQVALMLVGTLPRWMVRSVLRRNRFDANAGRRTPEIYQGVMLDIAC